MSDDAYVLVEALTALAAVFALYFRWRVARSAKKLEKELREQLAKRPPEPPVSS